MLDRDNTHEISWDLVRECVSKITCQIVDSKKTFDCIYGIPRGGYIPAHLLGHELNIPYTLAIDSLVREKYKNILIIDDISCTGKTLESFPEYTRASLFYRSESSVLPDFYGMSVRHKRFLVFPWELEYENG